MWLKRNSRAPVVPRGKMAVLLIDMQQEFVRELSDTDKEMVVTAQKALLQQCAQFDIPVIVVEYEGGGETLCELRQVLARIPRVVTLVKGCDNAFKRTKLHSMLSKLEASTVIMTGINASCCVQKTARSAVWRGYAIVTSETLIADGTDIDVADKNRPWFRRNALFCEPELPELQTLIPPIN